MSILEGSASKVKRPEVLRVAVLGCTGSIGVQTLDVCRQHADRLKITALSAYSSVDKLVAAAREFDVKHVALANEETKNNPALSELPEGCELGFGDTAVSALASLECVDIVVVAVVGFAGIWASYEALRAGKIWAPANKEALIVGGDILMPMTKPGRVIPIDSEHSAIFQCLVGERREDIAKIWLTCSGGPFFGKTREELASVTAAQALAHPTWTMGPKITIDSATLMNKGFEVMEAKHLFDVDIDNVEVLVHRQSKIHSAVEFSDGSVKAQMGPSDMRIPIQYALSYPERWAAPCEPIDWRFTDAFTFAAPDLENFKCLDLALRAGKAGGNLPCVVNAANEVVNEAFRKDACGFNDIADIIEEVLEAATFERIESLEQIAGIDAWAREEARKRVEALS